MPLCSNCQAYNDVTELTCVQCGQLLFSDDEPTTRDISGDLQSLFFKALPLILPTAYVPLMLPAPKQKPKTRDIKLHISGGALPLHLDPTTKSDIILGRRSPYGDSPTIDLTDYKAYLLGVSRQHAALRFNEDQICVIRDLGSANGTYVNGKRLPAHTPRDLDHGDEIWLAGLHLRIELY